jgi:hypothetical protein
LLSRFVTVDVAYDLDPEALAGRIREADALIIKSNTVVNGSRGTGRWAMVDYG